MKLTDMPTKPSLKKLNKVIESRFGFSIDYDSLTYAKAEAMRGKIMETVSNIRRSSAIHTAEQDPKYLEMLIVYEGLSRFIDAHDQMQPRRKLKEGELGQAEAILAAKDMVDTVQDMIEKVGKMQNEQLPALVDSIRDQIGAAQADTFKNSVGQTLGSLSQQLGQAREGLDSSARALTGEETAAAMSVPVGGADLGDEGIPAELGAEEMPDTFGSTGAAAGGAEEVGRGRR